jgi:small nuclear ribonucleoprotein (snRNP)-like protein
MESNNKKVKGSLVGVDGNAFALMGHFKRLATQQGFDND